MQAKILRVNTFTNFNFTTEEFRQMDSLEKMYPQYKMFVNCNSYNEITGKYPVVITLNAPLDKFIKPRGDISLIKAARIKYVADPKPKVRRAFEDSLGWCLNNNIPVLITYMRFRKIATLKKYCSSKFNYIWAKNYFRQMKKKTWPNQLINYCDLKEGGCPDCGNCARLTFQEEKAEIYSINLSSSGMCVYNCPDCYVKTISQWHGGTIAFDRITQNSKQIGKKDLRLYKYGGRQLTFAKFVEFTKKKNEKV